MKTLVIPDYPRRLSLVTLIYGIVVFLWLTPEDSIWLASLLGAGLAILLAAHALFRYGAGRAYPKKVWFPGLVALGAAIGGGSVITTALLMLVKTSVHNHLYPDYPLGALIGIMERAGAWSLAGGLVGLAAALVISARL